MRFRSHSGRSLLIFLRVYTSSSSNKKHPSLKVPKYTKFDTAIGVKSPKYTKFEGRIIKPTRVFKSSSCPNTLNESQFDQRCCQHHCPQQSPPSCIVSTQCQRCNGTLNY
ncbi:hypothetical protein HanPI659440_Chr04g0165621 [Helianthus annuus]|nr:hypothetical protein HanLR1_Chr04g0145031 [Helianthus annuus]KAJ0761640.1 hypothetical protein HanOQP8_Chr04g0152261 [Helianthus annuus]KAJ0796725.1 hypothetical protein HanPI659440_Chr04g0165621 [Helianthus annuus]